MADHPTVEVALVFYNSRPDLNSEQIPQTWDDMEGGHSADRETDDPVALWITVKAQMRAFSMGMTYSEPVLPHW